MSAVLKNVVPSFAAADRQILDKEVVF